jgi:uridine kinase
MLIGLCGGSGSGKSTFIEWLKEQFPGQVSVIDMDNYYISREELSFEERRNVNYDIPESLDWTGMIGHIKDLLAGKSIAQPKFSFQTYERLPDREETKAAQFIIVDGIFSFFHEELRNLYDFKIFLDVPSDLRFARRMLRNIKRYGRSPEFEAAQYFEKVKPMHERYVEPCKKYADMVLAFEKEDTELQKEVVRKLKEFMK